MNNRELITKNICVFLIYSDHVYIVKGYFLISVAQEVCDETKNDNREAHFYIMNFICLKLLCLALTSVNMYSQIFVCTLPKNLHILGVPQSCLSQKSGSA